MTPTTQAEPFSWQQTSYFDVNCNRLGYHLKACHGLYTDQGQLSGYYKQYYEEMCDVNGTRIADDWYYYDNGTWVPMSSSPCPLWD